MSQTSEKPTAANADVHKVAYIVNSGERASTDPVQTPRQLIVAERFAPPDQYQVLEERGGRVVLIGPESAIDLRDGQPRIFQIRECDAVFPYSFDQIRSVWWNETVNEADLRRIHGVPSHEIVRLERTDRPDKMIRDGDDVRLDREGSERFRRAPRPEVKIEVNEKKVTVAWGWITGAGVKAAAIGQGVEIEDDFVLTMELGEPGPEDDRVIGDEDPVFIKGGERFDAVDNHDDS